MTHEEVELLLGAYALDAVSGEEAAEIEDHLLICPRCRGELALYREVTATLAGGAPAPSGVWDRIAGQLAGGDSPAPRLRLLAEGSVRPRIERSRGRVALAAVAAAAIVAVLSVLGVQVTDLDHRVASYQSAALRGGLAPEVAAALAGAHQTVHLTDATGGVTATVAIVNGGQAYWIDSRLRQLPADRTYQLWGLADGRVVSLGLIGADPDRYGAFRVQPDVKRLMVTAEPEGGTPLPTTPVLGTGEILKA